jgi:hypothetical protein
VTRSFFDQVDDEVRGFVGPALRNFQTEKSGRLIKLWYEDPGVHFEAQRLSPTWSPSPHPCLEIGLHLESKLTQTNEAILRQLLESRHVWSGRLAEADYGEAFGPQGPAWRRLSEVIEFDAMDEEFAGEVAERVSAYIVTLQPLLQRTSGRSARRPGTGRPPPPSGTPRRPR